MAKIRQVIVPAVRDRRRDDLLNLHNVKVDNNLQGPHVKFLRSSSEASEPWANAAKVLGNTHRSLDISTRSFPSRSLRACRIFLGHDIETHRSGASVVGAFQFDESLESSNMYVFAFDVVDAL